VPLILCIYKVRNGFAHITIPSRSTFSCKGIIRNFGLSQAVKPLLLLVFISAFFDQRHDYIIIALFRSNHKNRNAIVICSINICTFCDQ
jgi:hypothetical protein